MCQLKCQALGAEKRKKKKKQQQKIQKDTFKLLEQYKSYNHENKIKCLQKHLIKDYKTTLILKD